MAGWQADFAVAFHDIGGRGVVRDLSARGLLTLALEGLEHLAAFPARERNGTLFEDAQRQRFDEPGGREHAKGGGQGGRGTHATSRRAQAHGCRVGRPVVGRNISFTGPVRRLLAGTLAACGFSAAVAPGGSAVVE